MIFTFEGDSIKTFVNDDGIYFASEDVAAALNFKDIRSAIDGCVVKKI